MRKLSEIVHWDKPLYAECDGCKEVFVNDQHWFGPTLCPNGCGLVLRLATNWKDCVYWEQPGWEEDV